MWTAERGPTTPIHEDKNSLNRILDIIKKGDDQELKEMNKKLQRMLEETLTKNMHLQQVSEDLMWYIVIWYKRYDIYWSMICMLWSTLLHLFCILCFHKTNEGDISIKIK